jgi:hypothetical protein
MHKPEDKIIIVTRTDWRKRNGNGDFEISMTFIRK